MTHPIQRRGPDLGSRPSRGQQARAPALRRGLLDRRVSSNDTEATASSMKQCQPSSPSVLDPVTSTPTRHKQESSRESGDSGKPSDPTAWFDQFNQNPSANLDGSHAMDADPPFFQNQSGGSNEGGPKDPIPHELLPTRKAPAPARPPPFGRSKSSSSSGEYRSVIDDLTVENKRLKDELRRYRHADDGALRKQKLFEVKTHGLAQWKKRELEATLREFAMGVGSTSGTNASSSMRKKSSRHSGQPQGSSSMSKHASSSSSSRLRPVDSAYASMSTGNTSGNSLGRRSKRATSRDTDQKVEDYLKDIPEGLYPRHITMSDREKKKVVVRRLEQLFTGKAKGKQKVVGGVTSAPTGDEGGCSREARILPTTTREGKTASAAASGSGMQSNTNLTSRSNTDLTSWNDNRSGDNDNKSGGNDNKSGGNDNVSGAGGGRSGSSSNISPTPNPPFEQRPTRPRDLDPDRMPDPSENMEYLRHLGVTAVPTGSPGAPRGGGSPTGVAADADGWVYLNLLCNLAQLHILNVSPSFVRAAVAEKSAKFQLSSDGRKIRWRGGSDGTAFSSESSAQGSGDGEGASSEDGSRKRRRTAFDDESGDTLSSERETSAEESFHYKPLFARGESPAKTTSQESSGSSGDSEEASYQSGTGEISRTTSSRKRKRRADGAIIYYGGAPFCTDLSGDPSCLSPNTYMVSSGEQEQEGQSSEGDAAGTGASGATLSGSSLAYRPLSAGTQAIEPDAEEYADSAMDTSSDQEIGCEEELEAEFPWSEAKQEPEVYPFEPCGLGGVLPEDHFVMTVTTRRSKEGGGQPDPPSPAAHPKAKVAAMVERLASKAPGPPTRKHPRGADPLDIEYVSRQVKRLRPATLPPPAAFLPPFSGSSGSSDWSEGEDEDEVDEGVSMSSEREPPSSRRVTSHNPGLSFGVSAGPSSDIEDGATEGFEDAGLAETPTKGDDAPVRKGSLVATAGGASSGYSSGKETSS